MMSPKNGENKSAVARLRQQITQEYIAAQQGLNGLAQGTSQHAFITTKMERLGIYQTELATLVGEQESLNLMCEAMEQADQQRPCLDTGVSHTTSPRASYEVESC